MTRTELDQIKAYVETCYHRAGRQYDLPYPTIPLSIMRRVVLTYWSCPMHPDEIAERLEDVFGSTITEEE